MQWDVMGLEWGAWTPSGGTEQAEELPHLPPGRFPLPPPSSSSSPGKLRHSHRPQGLHSPSSIPRAAPHEGEGPGELCQDRGTLGRGTGRVELCWETNTGSQEQ